MNILKITAAILLTAIATSDATAQLSKNWFNEDPGTDKYAGVSSDLTFKELVKGKEAKPVIVAVIDGGTDTAHPDLKNNLWVNEDEIAGNGKDDDGNGYIDDIHGWSFIGGKNGDVGYDTFEATRLYKKYKPLYEGKSTSGLTPEQKKEYQEYQKAKAVYEKEITESKKELAEFEKLKKQLDDMKLAMGGDDFKAEDVANYKSTDEEFNKLKSGIASAMSGGMEFNEIYDEIAGAQKHYEGMVKYQYNLDFDSRNIVGDNYDNYSEKNYGSTNVAGPEASHGTHVAGIIGADRTNDVGIKGVASNAKLMIVRVVPDGDERDKDVANGIRYAADNGASIINMSFGKSFSPGKKYVDEAVRYAVSKDVLIVHASGNDGSNIDKTPNFPYPVYENGTRESAWIEVGAISSSGDAAPFSNYGAKTVDVMAPGVKIFSTLPGGEYGNENGTSMAAPVVSGIAAIIRGYYPSLKASQVRQIIIDSSIKLPSKTQLPGSKKKKVKYSKLSVSAGIVNAYRAIKLADTYTN